MRVSLNKKNPLGPAVACALAMAFASTTASAQSFSPPDTREVWTTVPAQVWKNGFGECWHSAFGPPPGYNECNPAPQPVAQRVEPVPPVAVAAPKPAPRPMAEKITLDADALFDFDKAVLRPEGRAALGSLVGKLAGVELDAITAVGHTDRFGTDSYNQALSDRRAAAVRAYLVENGVQPNRMHTEGMGEKQPVTKPADCPGGATAKVIACLQPDRRVEVEVIGTRTTR